jgi:uncharacterized protein
MKISHFVKISMFALLSFLQGCTPNPPKTEVFFSNGALALLNAALKGDSKTVDNLLAEKVDIDSTGKDGLTPLMYAVRVENKTATQILLDRKADPNKQEHEGYSAMSDAAEATDTWFLETLLKHGGNPNLHNPIKDKTPLSEAVLTFNIKNIDILVKAGADLNFQEKYSKQTHMMRAANINRFDVVLYFIKAGADATIKDHWGRTISDYVRGAIIDPDSPLSKDRDEVAKLLKDRNLW